MTQLLAVTTTFIPIFLLKGKSHQTGGALTKIKSFYSRIAGCSFLIWLNLECDYKILNWSRVDFDMLVTQ